MNSMNENLTETARATFEALAILIEKQFQPPPRAAATAATFRQIAEIGGSLPLSIGDAVAGFAICSVVSDGDDGPVKGRRATCAELVALVGPSGEADEPYDARNLAIVFDAVADAFGDSKDPRQRAIRSTAQREAAEIRAALKE